MNNEISIYIELIKGIYSRLEFALKYLEQYSKTRSVNELESSILQMRKAFESLAFSSIAANKSVYAKLRGNASKNSDFSKDYNAKLIIKDIEKVNPQFYPIALNQPEMLNGMINFPQKTTGFLKREKFERIYERMGKYLHADNPWSSDKQIESFSREISTIVNELKHLLERHVCFLSYSKETKIWIVEILDIDNIIFHEAGGRGGCYIKRVG